MTTENIQGVVIPQHCLRSLRFSTMYTNNRPSMMESNGLYEASNPWECDCDKPGGTVYDKRYDAFMPQKPLSIFKCFCDCIGCEGARDFEFGNDITTPYEFKKRKIDDTEEEYTKRAYGILKSTRSELFSKIRHDIIDVSGINEESESEQPIPAEMDIPSVVPIALITPPPTITIQQDPPQDPPQETTTITTPSLFISENVDTVEDQSKTEGSVSLEKISGKKSTSRKKKKY